MSGLASPDPEVRLEVEPGPIRPLFIMHEATEELFEVAQRQQCARLLLMSSLAARHPELSWYAASKRQAEQRVASSARPAVTVFRPTAVYGPGDRELHPLFEMLMRGWLPTAGPQEARLSFLHVDDLVAAVMAWL